MNQSRIASLVVAAGLLAGCGGGAAEQKPVANTPAAKEAEPPPPPPAEPTDPADRILATMSGFKDDVCACTSAACVEGVEQKMMEWAMANMEELKEIEPTQAQDEEADRIEGEMDTCRARHAPAGSSSSSSSSTTLTPLPPGGTGSPACDEYLRTFDRIVVTCKDKLGPALDAMLQARNAQVEAFAQWATLDAASKKATVEAADAGCRSATDAIRQSAAAMECKL